MAWPNSAGSGTVFVTVGTTKFDALIRACDQQALADALVERGYGRLVMQVGAAEYTPRRLFPPNSRTAQLHNGLAVEFFDFAPSLAAHMEAAALVISHAGSGSIFEALRLRKPLVVVPNPLLMDNHQTELAAKLESLHHLFAATPDTLAQVIRGMDLEGLVPYEKGDPAGIAREIDALLGIKPASS